MILPVGGPIARHVAVHSWLKRVSPSKPLLYVADGEENVVNIYSATGSDQTPTGQLTGPGASTYFMEPQGLWVDINQNLWVASTNASTLYAFRRGSMTAFRTLTDPNGFPAGVCGNNNKPTVYAVDILSTSSGYGQTIDVYKKSSNSPSSVLYDTNAESLYECAVDSRGNLFVTLTNLAGGGEVDEFFKGTTTPVVLESNLVLPLGITVDRFNTLAVADFTAIPPYQTPSIVYLYNPPYTYGPAYSFTTTGWINEMALGRHQKQIWGADVLNRLAQEWSYPHGLFLNETSTTDLVDPDGLALSPAANQ